MSASPMKNWRLAEWVKKFQMPAMRKCDGVSKPLGKLAQIP